MIDPRLLFVFSATVFLGGPPASDDNDGLSVVSPLQKTARKSDANLELVQYIADSTAFHVNSVLIVGATEAILIDAQYHVQDARNVAEQIVATGKRLKAIVITHPDHDHYSGAAAIVERFPGTPVYMTAAGMHHFDSVGVDEFQGAKSRRPTLFPDSVVHPQLLPSTHLTVDGETVEIIPDLQGDVMLPVNSVVWIPSQRTVIAGDLVFNGVHAWLGASNEETRAAWRGALQRLIDLRPSVVIAGHKPTIDTPDSPSVLPTMIDYLADFDEIKRASSDGRELAESMRQKYAWKVAGLLSYSARAAFRSR